jgi:hypothetical protein
LDSDLSRLNELNEKRRALRPLLSPTDPVDALASYYALWHDPRRTQLMLHRDGQGRVDGFLAICQTGADLFRPLVTLRAPGETAVSDLLGDAFVPDRSYHLAAPVALAPALRERLEFSRASVNRIYILVPSRFRPIVNVLVQQVRGADGSARFQIESQGQVMAMAGTNWRSPSFAEVYVFVHPKGRGRGWGKSVVSAATSSLLEERLRPLYLAEEDNQASIAIATGLGYADTGAREFTGEGRLAPAPKAE